jgi:hypothetical protein
LIETNRYKIGCSNKNDLDRCKNRYKKGSRYLCIIECNNPFQLENIIKEHFNNKFKLIAGYEYFEGDENIMIFDFFNIVMKNISEPKIDNIIDINTELIIENIIDTTETIINTAENILLWFNENFKLTNNKKDFIKIKYIYDVFITSDYYKKIIKSNNKYTIKNFINDIESNNFFSNYYCKNNGIMKKIINCWVYKMRNNENIDVTTYKNLIIFNGDIISWFNEIFELTDNKENFIKIKDIYNIFTKSLYYENMTKVEKKYYNKTFFVDYFEKQNFFIPYYCQRYNNIRSIIKYWKIKNNI